MRESLYKEIEKFKNSWPVEEQAKSRVRKPDMSFYGEEILEMAVSAILAGENLLLCGDKATGKNILAKILAWLFGRPVYNISFHVNTDSSSLLERYVCKQRSVPAERSGIPVRHFRGIWNFR